jgi:hypothetical protein
MRASGLAVKLASSSRLAGFAKYEKAESGATARSEQPSRLALPSRFRISFYASVRVEPVETLLSSRRRQQEDL